MAGKRPGGVTFVVVLVIILGILQLPSGLLSLSQSLGGAPNWFANGVADGQLLAYAIVKIAFGVGLIVLGATLGSGSQVARVLTTIVLALNIASSFFGITFGGFELVGSVLGWILALIALILLYTKRANAFFR
ncbi:MAG: hypothetical protein J7480_08125 [Microbacteriaceae bacterium]|nr:hypothetical protein [Microbacteriaceae bacterium]